jgi:two-component system sensor histidine kinase EvgS
MLPRTAVLVAFLSLGVSLRSGATEARDAAGGRPARIVFGGDRDTPPYEYLDADGAPRGFNVELMRAIGRQAGVDVEMRLGQWSEIVGQFDAGRIDVMAMGYSDARSKRYDFIGETWTLHQVIVMRDGRASYPQDYRQLADEVVAVMNRGKIHDLVEELPRHAQPRLLLVPNVSEAVRALHDGRASGAGGNVLTLRHVAARMGVSDLVDVPAHSVPYLLAVPKGRASELSWIAGSLARIKETGEFARLVERLLTVPRAPLSLRDSLQPVAGILAALGFLGAAIVLWNTSLRRQVAARTAELASLLGDKDRLTQAIADSEKRYRQLVESAHAIVWRADAALARFSFVSKEAEAILGYPVTRWAETGFFAEHVHPEDGGIALAPYRDEADKQEREYRMLARDGRAVWFRSVTHLVSEDGRPAELIGVMLDVTDQKRLEAQLRQAQKMEAVGRLAGGIAHDFNNILTAIIGYGELLVRSLSQNETGRRRAEQICAAANKAASLTSQLLAFSRQQVVSPKVLDLNAVVAGLESILRRVIGDDVRLVTRLGRPAAVEADPSQLEQVILNLAVNGRDAMPEGGTLTIETARLAPAAGGARAEVMLAVRDTGIGMDAEVRSHIFEPFFTTKQLGKGTGLGLATVYGIVEQNGGRIAVESATGQGTTFRVYLPESERQASQQDDARDAAERSGSETILLVEDDDDVRQLVHCLLEAGGYRVIAARHAGEALVISERHSAPIHLLLTDVVMPEMSGRELAERLVPQRPGMRVLFVSGHTGDSVLKLGVMHDGVDFLQKPFTSAELAQRVRAILDGAGAPRVGAA